MPVRLAALKHHVRVLLGREMRLTPRLRIPTEFHGSSYGGWAIRQDSLDRDARVISVGVGEDVSFDESLIRKYGCAIHAYDPTPRSAAWVAAQVSDPRFHFEPVALAATDGSLRLYLPTNPAHVSASCRRSDHVGSTHFDAPCQRLATMLARLGWDAVNVLKLDIEGAEYDVLPELVSSGTIACVGQLLVEFHHHFSGFSVADTRRAIALLEESGLLTAWVSSSGRELLFTRTDAG